MRAIQQENGVERNLSKKSLTEVMQEVPQQVGLLPGQQNSNQRIQFNKMVKLSVRPANQKQLVGDIKINVNSVDSNYDKQHLASFLSNRKILAKDQSLVDTSIVVVSNLAAGTTDVKLRKMCQGIGEIKVRMLNY